MNNILHKIVIDKRFEVEQMKINQPLARLKQQVEGISYPSNRPFRGALSRAGEVNIIAELKKGSPSRGIMVEDFDPATLAMAYKEGGAAALSVLTDRKHFFGSFDNLRLAKQVTGLPVLCKDFFIDEYQVYKARDIGADAVLLIAAVLSDASLRQLMAVADSLRLDCLVEVHDRKELARVLACGATIIGVNSRNLRDFSTSIDTAIALGGEIPNGVVKVAESGIQSADDIRRLRQASFGAFLIGEALVRSDDAAVLLKELRQA